uniref:Uncharacterized protein n=1 Tax=Glossina austeni TaxID=7395 RepID=A0A1A9VLA4_GLOAU
MIKVVALFRTSSGPMADLLSVRPLSPLSKAIMLVLIAEKRDMARALSIGVIKRLVMSSVTKSGQFRRKLCITESAPALPSNVTCQVKESPRAFSDSSSLLERGNECLHNSNIRGNKPFTTEEPKVIMEPINSQPAWVRLSDIRLFCEAERSNSSAALKTIFPLVCGMPSGEW